MLCQNPLALHHPDYPLASLQQLIITAFAGGEHFICFQFIKGINCINPGAGIIVIYVNDERA